MQQTINQIVELFFSGGKDGPARACALYEDTIFEKYGGCREGYDPCGTVIPNELLEFDRDNAGRIGEFVTPERLDALAGGADPSEEEKQEYRRRFIAEVEDGEADYDYVPGYYIYPLRHTDGRGVFALETVKGYSFICGS